MGSCSECEEDFSLQLWTVLQCESKVGYPCANHTAFSLYQFASTQLYPWMVTSTWKSKKTQYCLGTAFDYSLLSDVVWTGMNCSGCPNWLLSFAFLPVLVISSLRRWTFLFPSMFKEPGICLPLLHLFCGTLKQTITGINPPRTDTGIRNILKSDLVLKYSLKFIIKLFWGVGKYCLKALKYFI